MRLGRRTKSKLVAGTLFLAAAFACLFALPKREPFSRGRPLSFWLEQYGDNLVAITKEDTARREAAEAAVRELGTNVIPHLLVMLQREARSTKEFAQSQNMDSLMGFRILGAAGEPAVPALTNIFKHPKSVPEQIYAGHALAAIGPAAKSATRCLVEAVSNSNAGVRLCAVAALGQIHSDPQMVVPALIVCLGDTDIAVRTIAARSLGAFGTGATNAVPALIKARGSVMGNQIDITLDRITNSIRIQK